LAEAYRRRLEEWFARDGIKPERVMELESEQAIIASAAADTGCGSIPLSLLTALRASRDLKQHQPLKSDVAKQAVSVPRAVQSDGAASEGIA